MNITTPHLQVVLHILSKAFPEHPETMLDVEMLMVIPEVGMVQNYTCSRVPHRIASVVA